MIKLIEKLESYLNYSFKNENLLKEALTHRSFTTENSVNYDNQRLEFLGDAVVQIIVTDYIYNKYKDKSEGELTAIRSALVKRESLAELAKSIKLEDYILLGKGEADAGGNKRDSVLCDAFEALIGAMYLDSDIETCRKLLLHLVKKVFPELDSITKNLNPKGYLQEITQKIYSEKPKYKVKESFGPEHDLTYIIEVSLNEKVLAVGKGKNIKAAEKSAALDAIKKLEK
jgi:ribonuclease III